MTIALTADTCAAAVVAAALAYGDDPIRALTAQAGRSRRSLAAAAWTLHSEADVTPQTACSVLGLSLGTYRVAEKAGTPEYRQAIRSAERALTPFRRVSVPSTMKPATPEPERLIEHLRAAQPVDHSDAIRAALARRSPSISVAGVDRDKARLGVPGHGGCRWHIHSSVAEQPCHADVVKGRLFCAEHCIATGQKSTPLDLPPAVMPAPYSDRSVAR